MSLYVSKVYTNVNDSMPKSYWDYGHGKYSEVFEGVDLANDRYIVIKVLKPVKSKKINREIKILENLRNGPNVINLYDVVKDDMSKTTSLIFERVLNVDFRSLYPTFTNLDIKYYMYQLLKLVKIARVLGTDSLYEYLKKYDIQLSSDYEDLGTYPRKPWSRFIDSNNSSFATADAIDFVDKLLRYDHQERLTAKEAMKHHYFDELGMNQ